MKTLMSYVRNMLNVIEKHISFIVFYISAKLYYKKYVMLTITR